MTTLRTLAVALAAVAVLTGGAGSAQEAPREIIVSGHGEVAVRPDIARVTLGVDAEGETAKAALDAMSARLSRVMAAIEGAGIAPEDRQTTSLALDPLYARGDPDGASGPRVTGYRAQSLVSLRIAEIEAVGGLIDTLAGAGANRIDAISFDVSDPAEAAAEARRLAVADARTKAGQFAEAAGVALGEVVTISDGGGGMPRPMAAARMAEALASVPVAEGSIAVSADVQVVYRITAAP
jgi:uncharacterized protein